MSEHWTLQAPDGSCLYTVDSEAEALKWCESDYGGANVIKPMRVHMAHELAAARNAALEEAARMCEHNASLYPYLGTGWESSIECASEIRALKGKRDE